MLTRFSSQLLDNIGNWNPQLFRELKGRFNSRNISLVGGLSIFGQILLYLVFQGSLPYKEGVSNTYCVGAPPPDWYGYSEPSSYIPNNYCVKDLFGNFVVMKDLWWLHMFITMSIIGIFVLLVIGSYMLIADLSKEERNTTLNFIRLSPQSAKTILVGKLLGVPALVYLFGLLAVPLHIVSGLAAGIPFVLIVCFYLALISACIFFYSASALYSLVSSSLGSFQAWLGSSAIFSFLLMMMGMTLENNSSFSQTPFDWLILFYPGTVLMYLVKSTFLNPDSVGVLSFNGLNELHWYGNTIWQSAWLGIAFILANFSIWTFWIWKGLQRRFHNPLTTVITKSQSYWISACFAVINLGFVFQDVSGYRTQDNVQILQLFSFILFSILIAALSPHRQALQDWSRYRHQNPKETRNLWTDLIIGEKSPAVLAIALNVGIFVLYTIPFLFIFSVKDSFSLLLGLIFGGMMAIIYATIVQFILMARSNKRGVIALGTGFSLATIIPAIVSTIWFSVLKLSESSIYFLGLFLPIPSVVTEYLSFSSILIGFLSQLTIIGFLNFKMTKALRKTGMSETKALMSQPS